MRFPEIHEIRDVPEQLKLYQLPLEANDKKTLLVTGPPGSGKTVVALYRAQKILGTDLDSHVTMVMYTNVLQRYCDNCVKTVVKQVEKGEQTAQARRRFSVKTWSSWIFSWYCECKRSGIETDGWYLGNHKWDWKLIHRTIRNRFRSGEDVPGWDHLIIDEAQDFKKGFFKLAGLMVEKSACSGLMVLADENQQIHENESTIEEIATQIFRSRAHLEPDGLHHHQLRANFRNTRSIAQVAGKFYTGVGAPPPELPPASRSGDLPLLLDRDGRMSLESLIEQAVRIATSAPGKKIGVITDYAKPFKGEKIGQVEQVKSKLEQRLGGREVSHYFSTNDKEEKRRLLEALEFDKPGAITVLNAQSVKGLEFDAVICLRSKKLDSDYRKQSYVACSRAREDLIIVSRVGNGFRDLLAPTGLVEEK
jgi:DNA helicase IV